jgi:glycosyltransferase involved in cell wall biosynthesis
MTEFWEEIIRASTKMATGKSPLISIIICNYNYGRFLRDAIECALAQTYRPTEVIVVDDGSTDDSRKILGAYSGRIPVILKENGGQSSAFNEGFAASKGDIVIFLDSDDMLFPSAAAKVVATWRPGIAKVQYRLRVTDAQGNPKEGLIPSAQLTLPNGDLRAIVLSRGTYITPFGSGNAYSRHVLEKIFPVRKEDHHLPGDVYLIPLAAFYGDIISIDEVLGFYRIHGDNMWSHGTIDPDKFVQNVLSDQAREAYIRKVAADFNLRVSFSAGSVNSILIVQKLAAMLLKPECRQIIGENLGWVVYRGIRSAWKEPELGLLKRIAATVFILTVPIFPRRTARMMLQWYLCPELRPAFLTRLL